MTIQSQIPLEDLLPDAVEVYTRSQECDRRLNKFFETCNLLTEAIENEGRMLIYTKKHRCKPTQSIMAKVARKRSGAEPGTDSWFYGPRDVSDGCGFRFVTLFQDDIVIVLKEIIQMVRRKNYYDSPSNPISRKNGIHEIITYTNRPMEDPDSISVAVDGLLEEEGLTHYRHSTEYKHSGYSSVHVIINVNLEKIKAQAEDCQTVEIQIRDIFEEAWSEIDHTLRYVADREESNESGILSIWKPHLNALKTFSDGCSQHARLIKSRAIDKTNENMNLTKLQTSGEPADLASLVKKQLPAKLHGEVDAAYAALNDAMRPRLSGAEYDELPPVADLFAELLEKSKPHWDVKTGNGRSIEYHLKMELAFCLQPRFKNDKERKKEQDRVSQIYDEMAEKYPDDTFSRYRHGMAQRKRGNTKRAISLLREAIERLDSDNSRPNSGWLKSTMHRHLGIAYYTASRKSKSDRTSKTLIENGYKVTEAAYEIAVEDHESSKSVGLAVNNLAFFSFYALERFGAKNPVDATEVSLREQLTDLEERIEQLGNARVYGLHTLALCYEFLGSDKQSKDAAARAGNHLFEFAKAKSGKIDLGVHEVRQHLPEELHDVHDNILRILFAKPPNKER